MIPPIIIKAKGFPSLFEQLVKQAEPGSMFSDMMQIKSMTDSLRADLCPRQSDAEARAIHDAVEQADMYSGPESGDMREMMAQNRVVVYLIVFSQLFFKVTLSPCR